MFAPVSVNSRSICCRFRCARYPHMVSAFGKSLQVSPKDLDYITDAEELKGELRAPYPEDLLRRLEYDINLKISRTSINESSHERSSYVPHTYPDCR